MKVQLFIKVASYVIAIYSILFTLLGYLAYKDLFFGKKRTKASKNINEEKFRQKVNIQLVLVFLNHFLLNFVVFIQIQDFNIVALYFTELIIIAIVIFFYRKIYKSANQILLNNILFLITMGLAIIKRLSMHLAYKQAVIISVVLLLSLLLPLIISKLKNMERLSIIYALIGVFLLLAVSFFGKTTNGAKNWIYIYGISIQLSELVKIAFVLFLASALNKNHSFKKISLTGIVLLVYIGLLVSHNDLGAAVILYMIFIIMVFLATRNYLYVIGGFIVAVLGSAAAILLFNHVQDRIFAWIKPFEDIAGKGYQITQSLFAIGSGGWFGSGINEGMPYNIPYVETDFIYSAIVEELGILVGICIALVFLNIVLVSIRIAKLKKTLFASSLTTGLAALIGVQTFLVIGGVTRLIPHTGVTLPYMSYGGSSVSVSILIFTLLQISAMKQPVKPLRKNKQGKSQLSVLGICFVIGYSLLIFNICRFYIFESKHLLINPYNFRQAQLEQKIIRGTIYDRNGNRLAYSEEINDRVVRLYPYDNLFAHAIGYSNYGKTGLEAFLNTELLKSDLSFGDKLIYSFSDKKLVGNNVITTLDLGLQQLIYDALANNKGAVIVSEVKTGKILAMVSKPDYNPNEIDIIWEELNQVGNKEANLLNRATQGLYPPGSTFKIVTSLAFMNSNPNYANYDYQCKGNGLFNNNQIHCAGNSIHGKVNLFLSLAKSCNTSFANIGTKLSAGQFQNAWNSFYYDENNFEIPYNKSNFALNSSSPKWEYPQTAIGQGKTEITPFQNLIIISTIANDGKLLKPYIVDRIENAKGSILKQTTPIVLRQAVTLEQAKDLQKMLRGVVTIGTAKTLSELKVEIAGKTGSAEYSSTEETHAWFVGYAPYDNPEIAVSIILESVGSSSAYALPVAKQIFEYYFSK